MSGLKQGITDIGHRAAIADWFTSWIFDFVKVSFRFVIERTNVRQP